MPKYAKLPKPSKDLPRHRKAKEWSIPANLLAAFKAHESWPSLKANEWQPIARAELGLDSNITVRDRKYNVIRQLLKNERRR